MDYLTLAALLWLTVFLLIGFWRGFWPSLAALASLVVAYSASLYFARPVSDALVANVTGARLNSTLVWVVVASALFLLAGLLARWLVLMLGRALPLPGLPNKLGGALFSCAYGAMLGVFVIWSYAFVRENYEAAQGRPITPHTSGWVEGSKRIVSRLVDWNLRMGGGSDSSAALSAAVAARPSEVLFGVRKTLQSPAFMQAVNDPELQAALREQDLARLQSLPQFQQVLESAGVQELRESLAKGGAKWTDAELARYTMMAGYNIDRVRSDPEFIILFNDEEVQAFLKGEAPVSATVLRKGQRLLQVISQKLESAEPAPATAPGLERADHHPSSP